MDQIFNDLIQLGACVCVGVSASMAGFLAAETLCEANVSESTVAREMLAVEQKQQAFKTNQQSHGMCTTQYRCGGYSVLFLADMVLCSQTMVEELKIF